MTESYNLSPENFEVLSETEIVWMGEAIADSSAHVWYIPCAMKDGQMGYCVRDMSGGREEFIYLNPSGDSGGEPNVFIYQGENNDPASDAPLHHYCVADGWLADDLRQIADDPDLLGEDRVSALIPEAQYDDHELQNAGEVMRLASERLPRD